MPKTRWAKLGDGAQEWRSFETIELVMLYGMLERSGVRIRDEAVQTRENQVAADQLFAFAAEVGILAMSILDAIVARLESQTVQEDYLYNTIQLRYWGRGVSPT